MIGNKLIYGYSYGSQITYVAIEATFGTIIWTYEASSVGEYFAPVVNGNNFIFPSRLSDECQLTCLDIETGRKKWLFTDKVLLYRSEILQSFIHSTCPLVQCGILFFASLGKLLFLDPITGLFLKSIPIPRTHRTHYQLTLNNDNIYFVINTDLVEFNLNQQTITNELKIGSSILTAPIISGNLLAFASISTLFIYDTIKRAIRMSIKLEGTIYSNPAFSDGFAIVATGNKKVYCIE